MRTNVGLWIDHRQAMVVTLTEQGEELGLIISQVEKHLRRGDASARQGAYEAQLVPADDRRQRAFTGQLNTFYDAVTASVRQADAILIFGPGEAKDELRKRLRRNNFGGRLVGVEIVDKMTERQIVAKVRQHFAAERSGTGPARNLANRSRRHGRQRRASAR
jgi:hypothetical protein